MFFKKKALRKCRKCFSFSKSNLFTNKCKYCGTKFDTSAKKQKSYWWTKAKALFVSLESKG